MRRVLPCLVSGGLHTAILLVLAWWIIPAILHGEIHLASAFIFGEDIRILELPVESEHQADVMDSHAANLDDSFLADSSHPDIHQLAEDLLGPDTGFEPDDFAAVEQSEKLLLLGQHGSLRRTTTVEGAVDRLTAGVRGDLKQGDVFVVWLFDASKSLVDDRRRIAARLEAFLDEIQRPGDDAPKGMMINAVAGFGARLKERVRPTRSRQEVVEAIGDLPIDPSGEENVFGAIAQCIARYASDWEGKHGMIVVWTDESGDDAESLEDVLALCANWQVEVHIVGPSSVLGDDTGFHTYEDPRSDITYLLPVTRGPDSAVRERLRLPYWFEKGPSNWQVGVDEDPAAMFLGWAGGRDLKGIASGFGPYALSRLAIETDGTYTIFDAPKDRPPYEPTDLVDYLPSYKPEEVYLRDIQRHPLRRAVLAAVQVTHGSEEIETPPLMLFGEYTEGYPRRFEAPYLNPSQFRSKLRSEQRRIARKATWSASVIETALAHVAHQSRIEEGLTEEYADEPSPRWRAWYDLTRGRLLAISVRLEEYRLAWEELIEPGQLEENSNFVNFFPRTRTRSQGKFRQRTAEAERLLTRCVQQNPNTPWEYLAQRELEFGLGIMVRQTTLRPVQLAPATKRPNLPRY